MRSADFESLPLFPLNGTEMNDPTGYTPIQAALLDYVDYYHTALWLVFFGLLFYMVFRYIRPAIFAPATPAPALAVMVDGDWKQRAIAYYKRIFRIDEIENDLALRLFGGAILLGFMVTFRGWESSTLNSLSALNSAAYTCWPFFQDCGKWILFDSRPAGYTLNTIFMAMFGLIFLAVYGLIAKKYVLAHACILVLFIFKMYVTLINFSYNANYDYYHTVFCFVFLFVAHKRFFGSLAVIMLYFLSTAAKIHETWTLGTYFSSLQTDLPLFPKGTTMLWTNIVIGMEMVGAWFLMSRNKYLQRPAVFFFACFHLYSGILVGYHYPSIVMPSLLIFFGPLYKPFERVPMDFAAMRGWLLISALICLQMISHLIPGDEKLTMEGNFYGLYMFEANHQCIVRVQNEVGLDVYNHSSINARHRCDPYRVMFQTQNIFCKAEPKPRMKLQIGHSINGGPFYRIVNTPDLCSLTYTPFGRNHWIETEETAKPMGRPHKNLYW